MANAPQSKNAKVTPLRRAKRMRATPTAPLLNQPDDLIAR
jgi:hypothetical protein